MHTKLYETLKKIDLLPSFIFILIILMRLDNLKIEPTDGLDPSWQWYLSFAQDKHLIFGKDIIYTWGPMAYLETGMCLSNFQITSYIIFSVFKAILFTISFKKIKPTLSADHCINNFSIIFYFLICSSILVIGDCGYLILILLLLIVTIKDTDNNEIILIGFSCVMTLGIFIKLTLTVSIIIITLIFINNRNLKFSKKESIYTLTTILISYLFVEVNSKISVFDFIINSIEVIKGYSTVMAVDTYNRIANLDYLLLGIAFSLILVFSNWSLTRRLIINKSLIFLLFYTLFRSSYTRFDHWHALQLLTAFPVLLLLIKVCNITINNQIRLSFISVTALLFLNHSIEDYLPSLRDKLKISNIKILPNDASHIVPKNHDKYIQNGKCLLIANRLTPAYTNSSFFIPPSPQNFCTYTNKLDNLNSVFSKKKFDFIYVESELFHHGVDKTHPNLYNYWFFQNIKNYTLIDSIKYSNIGYFIFKPSKPKEPNHPNRNLYFEKSFMPHEKIAVNDIYKMLNKLCLQETEVTRNKKTLSFEILAVHKSINDKLKDIIRRPLGIILGMKNNRFTLPENYLSKKLLLYPIPNSPISDNDSLEIDGRFKNVKIKFYFNTYN